MRQETRNLELTCKPTIIGPRVDNRSDAPGWDGENMPGQRRAHTKMELGNLFFPSALADSLPSSVEVQGETGHVFSSSPIC